MHQPRGLGFIFLAPWTFLLHVHFSASTPSKWVQTLPTFLDANTVHEVVVDQNSGDVFVGGRNVLYHLSADLELKKKVSTGPLMDYPGCPIPPYSCGKPRVATFNDVQLMKMVYYFGDTPSILVCGTVYNKLCQVRPIDNLEEYHWVHPYNETLGYVTNQNLNYALFESGYDGQLSLFTAAQDGNSYRNQNSAPYLSSRVLEKEGDRYYFRYTLQNNTISSAVFIKGSSSRFTMDGGFVYGDFMYFPVVYFMRSSIVESRLVRFCTKDPTFRSYAELPISCDYKGKIIKRFMAAHLSQSRSSTGKALYVSFNDDSSGSALCIFEMDSIVKAFTKEPRSCNRDIVGETCDRKNRQNIVDFCGSTNSPYIVSHPFEVEYYVFIPGTVITALTIIKQNGELVAIAGPNIGLLLKISMSTGKIISITDMIDKSEKKPFVSPFVFDKEEKHIYLLIKNKVIKYPVGTCAVHETCEECFNVRGKADPLKCGWCEGRCAHVEECSDPGSFSPDTCTPSIDVVVAVTESPVATCAALQTCGECFNPLGKGDLKCGWCAGKCAQLEECADPGSFSLDTCTPTIDKVFPLKGPIQGRNTIKITGNNFGSYMNDSHSYISVAGIGCKVSSWNNTQVICTLGPTPEVKSGPIELYVINPTSSTLGYRIAGSALSRSNFSYYVGPRLYGIRPSKGPTSGGTFVTLFGQDLDFEKDKERSVSVHGRLCGYAVFEKNKVRCTTGNASSRMFSSDSIAIHIDGVAYVMDNHSPLPFNVTGLSRTFEYTTDPYISYIQPRFTTVSGLINLTVTGKRLDTVKYPKLVVKIDEIDIIGKSEFFEDCWSDPESNGTTMTCRTPSLRGKPIRHPVPRHPHPLVTHVSFIMDNVQKLRDFKKPENDLSRLLYYPDPELEDFQETETIKMDQRVLEIKGTYLDLMHLADNLMVRIGENETCNITSVSSNILLCDLPPSLFSSSSEGGTNISVEVFVGSKMHHLGYIELDPHQEGSGLWTILWVVAIIIVITLGVIFVVYKLRVFYRKKPLNIGELALANQPRSSHVYRAVPTRASTSYRNPVPVAVTTPSCSANPVPVAVTSPSSSENPVPVAVSTPSSSENPVPVAGSPGVHTPHVDNDTLFSFADKNLIIQRKDLTLGEQIGEGQFGCVNEGYLQLSNQTERTKVAVKTLREHSWSDPKTIESFLKEALIMKDFNHPNVLGLMGVCIEGGVPSIVLPYMENKDLYHYLIDENRKVIFTVVLLKFAVDVAAGMSYLETNKFLHRDLAARNCVLDSRSTAKVADFGLSRDIYEDDCYWQGSKGKIPYKWTAPESLLKHVFSTKSDVWSYGVLLWEIMTRGSIPYSHIDNFHLLMYLNQGYRLDQPQKCPLPLYRVMLTCWNMDSKLRPSFHELHDYVRQIRSTIEDNTRAAALQPDLAAVPAQNTEYFNSEELYRNMEGRPLSSEVFQEF